MEVKNEASNEARKGRAGERAEPAKPGEAKPEGSEANPTQRPALARPQGGQAKRAEGWRGGAAQPATEEGANEV